MLRVWLDVFGFCVHFFELFGVPLLKLTLEFRSSVLDDHVHDLAELLVLLDLLVKLDAAFDKVS